MSHPPRPDEREAIERAARRDAELASGAIPGRSHGQVMQAARMEIDRREAVISHATTCARPADDPASRTAPLAPPIYRSAVYRVEGLDQIDAPYEGRESGFIYAR